MDQTLRTNLKKTAAKLFLKYGLRSVSIDDICNELHISKKTFYTQFSQKEALIESVLMEHNEKRIKKQESKTKFCDFDGNAIDQLLRVSDFHNSMKNDRFVNFFYDLNKYYPDIHKRMSQKNHLNIKERVQQNIQTGISEGLYRSNFDQEMMVRYLTIQFDAVNNLSTKELNPTFMRKSMELMIDIIIRVLCNRQGLDYYERCLAAKEVDASKVDFTLKDEDLDQIINEMMDCTEDEFRQTLKKQADIQ